MLLDNPADGTRQLRTFSPQIPDPLGELRLIFDGAPHGMIVVGEDSTILFVNASASKIFAYSPGELLGQPLSQRGARADAG